MSYDPRPEILALFTDEKIEASDGEVTDFVEVFIRERNPKMMAEYNGAGVICMETPLQGKPVLISIGGDLHKVPSTIIAKLYVHLKDTLEYPDVFIKNVIDTFQKTIRTNRNSIISNGDVEGFGDAGIAPSEDEALLGRTMLIYCFKFE